MIFSVWWVGFYYLIASQLSAALVVMFYTCICRVCHRHAASVLYSLYPSHLFGCQSSDVYGTIYILHLCWWLMWCNTISSMFVWWYCECLSQGLMVLFVTILCFIYIEFVYSFILLYTSHLIWVLIIHRAQACIFCTRWWLMWCYTMLNMFVWLHC